MTTSRRSIPHTLLSWFFLLYFVILFAERTQSLIRAAAAGQLFSSRFEIVAEVTVCVSLLAAVVLLGFFNGSFWKSLFGGGQPDYAKLSVTSGVILISGMVHTLYTIPAIQFVSYGMLIFAMILRTVQLTPTSGNRFGLWYSLGYLTAFSMAIPVVYQYDRLPDPILFTVIEYLVMAALVVSFTIMLRRLFLGKGENLLLWLPFAAMVLGDTAVLWMGWTDTINSFVLIFAALSAVLFLTGTIIFLLRKPKV